MSGPRESIAPRGARRTFAGAEWKRPEIGVALAHQLELHPSEVVVDGGAGGGKGSGGGGDRGRRASVAQAMSPQPHSPGKRGSIAPGSPHGGSSVRRRPHPLCIGTGRYCTQRCDRVDCCKEGRVSSLSRYGAAATTHFKSLKALVWIFVILFITSLPSLVINVAGPAKFQGVPAVTLGATTIGNLASATNSTLVILPATSAAWSQGWKVEQVSILYAVLDVLGCLLVLAGFWWMKRFEATEAQLVDNAVVTVSHYTILVENLLPTTTAEDLKAHFQRVAGSALFNLGILRGDGNSQIVSATPASSMADRAKVASVQPVKDNMKQVGAFVRRGAVHRQLERLSDRIGALKHLISTRGEEPSWWRRVTVGDARYQLTVLEQKRDALLKQAQELKAKASTMPVGGTLAAFVTFERQEARNAVLADYDPSSSMRWLCQPKRLRLNEKRRLTVKPAPPPSTVLWQNMNVGKCSRCLRQTFTTSLAVLLLCGSFVLLFFASYYQQRFTMASRAADCTLPEIVNGIASGSINSTSVANMPVEAPQLFCFCATLGFEQMSLNVLHLEPLSSKCPAQMCPRLWELAPHTVELEPACVKWLSDRSVTTTLIVISSLAILLINQTIPLIMAALTAFEGHHSVDDLHRSLVKRIFAAVFANTAILVVIINAPWGSYVRGVGDVIQTAKYDDFTNDWYNAVGTSIMITMLVNIFSPHLGTLFQCLLWRAGMKRSPETAQSQRDLNARFIGPAQDYSMRWAQIVNTVFVCLTFGVGMPLLNGVAMLSLFVSYWADKIFFLRYFRRPAAYSNSMARSMTGILPYAVVFHLALGAWMLTAPSLYSAHGYDPFKVKDIVAALLTRISRTGFEAVDAGASRVTHPAGIPLLVLMCLTLAGILLSYFLGVLGAALRKALDCLTCGCKHRLDHAFDDSGAVLRPTFSEACAPELVGTNMAIQGARSYSLLENPVMQDAFAITPQFARLHRTVSSLAQYTVVKKGAAGNEYLDVDEGAAPATGKGDDATGIKDDDDDKSAPSPGGSAGRRGSFSKHSGAGSGKSARHLALSGASSSAAGRSTRTLQAVERMRSVRGGGMAAAAAAAGTSSASSGAVPAAAPSSGQVSVIPAKVGAPELAALAAATTPALFVPSSPQLRRMPSDAILQLAQPLAVDAMYDYRGLNDAAWIAGDPSLAYSMGYEVVDTYPGGYGAPSVASPVAGFTPGGYGGSGSPGGHGAPSGVVYAASPLYGRSTSATASAAVAAAISAAAYSEASMPATATAIHAYSLPASGAGGMRAAPAPYGYEAVAGTAPPASPGGFGVSPTSSVAAAAAAAAAAATAAAGSMGGYGSPSPHVGFRTASSAGVPAASLSPAIGGGGTGHFSRIASAYTLTGRGGASAGSPGIVTANPVFTAARAMPAHAAGGGGGGGLLQSAPPAHMLQASGHYDGGGVLQSYANPLMAAAAAARAEAAARSDAAAAMAAGSSGGYYHYNDASAAGPAGGGGGGGYYEPHPPAYTHHYHHHEHAASQHSAAVSAAVQQAQVAQLNAVMADAAAGAFSRAR